jgi:hypothetical protein
VSGTSWCLNGFGISEETIGYEAVHLRTSFATFVVEDYSVDSQVLLQRGQRNFLL